MKQIDAWRYESINKIRQTAENTSQLALQHTMDYRTRIETRLNKLTNELQQSRKENDFFEPDLRQWKEELENLTKELNIPSNVKLQQDSKSLVSQLYVDGISNNSKYV